MEQRGAPRGDRPGALVDGGRCAGRRRPEASGRCECTPRPTEATRKQKEDGEGPAGVKGPVGNASRAAAGESRLAGGLRRIARSWVPGVRAGTGGGAAYLRQSELSDEGGLLLRASSRETTDGQRPTARAISRTPSPPARINAIASRSSNVNGRRTRGPGLGRVGFTPPAPRNHLFPASFDAPSSTAALPGDIPDLTSPQNSARTSRATNTPCGTTTTPSNSGCCYDPWTPPIENGERRTSAVVPGQRQRDLLS